MEELFDVVDQENEPTGEQVLRSVAHAEGVWHRTVHIYLFKEVDGDIQLLVHLRAKTKDLHPNCWDTRFGGHIKSGESIEASVESELIEEVGLRVNPNNLIKGGVYKTDHYPNREFNNVFYYRFDGETSTLKFNDGEVQEVKWMKSSDIINSMSDSPESWASNKEEVIKVIDVLKGGLKI